MKAYQAIQLGDVRFPANPAEGVATVEFTAQGKIDRKEPHGKDDERSTWVGRKGVDVKIELRWTWRIAEETEAFLFEISPRGPRAGKPFELVHPDASLYDVRSVLIQQVGPIKRDGLMCSCSVAAVSWTKPKAAGKSGGVKTPTSAQRWTAPEAAIRGIVQGAGTVTQWLFTPKASP